MVTSQPPTREEVSSRWRAVARGDMAREAACQWAEQLLCADFDPAPDEFLKHALQSFRQFDLTYRSEDPVTVGHGPPGDYVRTLAFIAEAFEAWIGNYEGYIADPDGWAAAHRAEPARSRSSRQ